ncbi:VOC family protein [Microbacterium sp. EST19A]|uniref:VOC family protein n=1 Tax=Microbacterium sp. EST19A TaxID=2862681 RepID=UPI0027DF9CC0|nr:VOC family protein [Microbacterium sp. EST19A]
MALSLRGTVSASLRARLGCNGGMRVERVVPNLTVEDVRSAVQTHRDVLGWSVVMDHGWIVTLADDEGRQLSIMDRDASAAVNPDVSIFVDDVHEALRRAIDAGAEIVHPLTEEHWGVTRFFYRDAGGSVINVGTHA